jgi:hypothetical protein
MHRSLPSSARLAWARALPRTAVKLPLLLPRSPDKGVIYVRKIYTECNAKLGDVIVCCLIQLWVGHIHLNKHLDRVSLLGRLLVYMGYSLLHF